jgi:hypothetical protein
MMSDFHYGCIRVLAHRAGFDAAESEILAYASQYTDHATEHKPIQVKDLPLEARPQIVRGLFNPVCTAHEALQYVTQWKSHDAQRKVYIAFHFVPPAAYSTKAPFGFIVQPDSELVRLWLTEALEACAVAAEGSTARLSSLIRVGIALHSLADTWAHQGFSGRWSPIENDVQERQVWTNGQWQSLPLHASVILDAAPDVGHAEVGEMADDSALRFRYRRASDRVSVIRDNRIEFLQAAKTIYAMLRTCTSGADEWEQLGPQIAQCLANPGLWRLRFPDVFSSGDYDRFAWRRSALRGDRYDWDSMSDADEFAALEYSAGSDLKWFLFHVEAARQREYVLRKIAGAAL